MFSRFNEEAQKVLVMAKKEMMDLRHAFVGSEHLFLAILKESSEFAERFQKYGVTYTSFRDELIRMVGMGEVQNQWFVFTPLLKRVIENASLTAKEMNSSDVQISHLLLSMLEEGDGIAIRTLIGLDVEIEDLYEEFSTLLVDKKCKQKRKLLIEEFGIDLTRKAMKGEIDPVIGRGDEIQRVIEILSRRTKNNPLLVGEAGVGKTAIVEELARRIVSEQVPDLLRGKRIISVEIASLVAGTKYRGEFEERVHKILREVESHDDIIIFIDEVHTLVGAGGAEGAIDASNILKPALARGKLRLIGATTTEEYKKTIEKDKAFDRRFQKLEVLEPSFVKTYQILLELKDLYSSFHQVKIQDSLIREIIRLTDLYIYNRKQPDKSIDILDEVCARVQLHKSHVHERINDFRQELEILKKQKRKYISNQDFQRALEIREQEYQLLHQLNNLELKKRQKEQMKEVTLEDIKSVIVEKTGIPIFDMDSKSLKELRLMEEELSKKIIGQEEAVHQLCDFTKRLKLGFYESNRPASFLFVGPTGVGKTYLVKEYAKFIGGEDNLVRLDMSEYRESHTVSKIIGAPSGYVGYDDGKNILEEIRNHPYCVVLLDEIEKAHPAVLNLFLQILDEGFIKDSMGRKISFAHTTIIMTSNIGFGREEIGFCKDTVSIHSKLKEFLSIEFINRIDQVLVFQSLKEESVRAILDIKLMEVRQKFLEKGIRLNIRRKIYDEIVEMSQYQEFGARKIGKIIENKIDSLVIDEMLLGKKNVTITHFVSS